MTAESGGAIRLWDLPAGKHRATLIGHRGQLLRAHAFSPYGSRPASGDALGHLAVWDLAKEKAAAEFKLPKSDGVLSLSFTADGKTLAVGGDYRKSVRFLTPDGKAELAVVKDLYNGVYALAFSADGKMMATGDDSHARLWDVPKPK